MDKLLWSEQGLDRHGFVLVFGLITIATIVVALIRAFTFFSLCMKSSIKLEFMKLMPDFTFMFGSESL